MNRKGEISILIDSYIERVNFLKPQIKWNNYRTLTTKLKEYQNILRSEEKINSEWFNSNFIDGKSEQGEIFEHLNSLDSELFNISIRLRNLNAINPYNQISSSITHYKPFVKNSENILEQLGFNLLNKSEHRNEYINRDKIIISLIYQRFDPPEVYIKRETDEKYLRIGPMLEFVINGSKKIWEKHSGENGHYFNYSKFEYYRELLNSVYEEISKRKDFVIYYNEQMKSDL